MRGLGGGCGICGYVYTSVIVRCHMGRRRNCDGCGLSNVINQGYASISSCCASILIF